jgi:hypothetical protein
MKKWLVIAASVGLIGCAKADELKVGQMTSSVGYRVTSKIVTNEVSASDYNAQTNGYKWIEKHMCVAQNIQRADADRIFYVAALTNVGTYCWIGANQTFVNAPDPFKEKVTVTRFVKVREDLYQMEMGPFLIDVATEKTVLERWAKKHTQTLNMVEKEEVVHE